MSNHLGFGDIADADINIDILADQIDRMIDHFKPDFQQWVTLGQFGKRRRQMPSPDPKAGADPDQAVRLCVAPTDCLGHPVRRLEDTLRPLIDRLAVVGDRHLSRRSVEQLDLQGLFQNRNPLADESRRFSEVIRGGDKTRTAGGNAEKTEIGK